MNWLKRLFGRRVEKRSQHTLESFLGLSSLSNSVAGATVNETTALNLSTVYACIRTIAEDLGSLGCTIYERTELNGKRKATEHRLYRLLHDEPNSEQTAMVFYETMLQWLLRYGNSFAEIERSNSGEPLAMHIIPPTDVEVKRVDGKLTYRISQRGTLNPNDIIHLRLMGTSDLGYSPIKLARESIGLGLSVETFASAYFGNSGRPGGVISHPKVLTQPAAENLRKSIQSVHGGSSNFGKIMVLEEGATYVPFTIPEDDSMFLGLRVYQLQEICRWFRMPPTMVADLSNGKYDNVEAEAIKYVKNCLRPTAIRFESELSRKLFLPTEKQRFFCEFNLDALLRGDPVSRSQALKEQFQSAALGLHEWRALEGRGEITDPNMHFMQSQMATLAQIQAGQAGNKTPAPPAPPEDQSRDQAIKEVLVDNLSRMLRREARAIQRAASHPREFLKRVDEFYESHRTFMAEALAPSIKVWNDEEDSLMLSSQLCEDHREQLIELSGTVTASGLKEIIDKWAQQHEQRAEEIIQSWKN